MRAVVDNECSPLQLPGKGFLDVDGNGYSTEFVLFRSPGGRPGDVTVRLLGQSGAPLALTFQ